MKKNILLILALAAGLTACTGDYDDWAAPQTSTQDDVANISMTVEVAAPASVIEMEAVEDDSVQVFVPVTIESTVNPTYSVVLTTEEGVSLSIPADARGYCSTADLAAAIVELYGKKQAERTMTAQVIAQTVVDGVTLKSASEKFTLKVLPAVPDLNYWIYGKQNNRNETEKTLPLMPVTKESQTVTTYFSGMLDTKMWSDDSFGNAEQVYGALGSSNKKAMSGEFAIGGGYICPTSAGWYTLTFNFATYQYTFTRLENQAPTAYTSVSLIGDFNQWGSDLALTQVVSGGSWASHCWYALGVELAEGGLKFRANNEWAVNWGAGQNVKDASYGVGTQDGPNITVPAGTYDVYFNDITGEFLFIAQ
ncbi:MAG: DUF5115 domain-containing protein [Bacteroidaceae bacterium]|nr:DUF5115 domain-containing protein [Bacteroidaceae bacterium]